MVEREKACNMQREKIMSTQIPRLMTGTSLTSGIGGSGGLNSSGFVPGPRAPAPFMPLPVSVRVGTTPTDMVGSGTSPRMSSHGRAASKGAIAALEKQISKATSSSAGTGCTSGSGFASESVTDQVFSNIHAGLNLAATLDSYERSGADKERRAREMMNMGTAGAPTQATNQREDVNRSAQDLLALIEKLQVK